MAVAVPSTALLVTFRPASVHSARLALCTQVLLFLDDTTAGLTAVHRIRDYGTVSLQVIAAPVERRPLAPQSMLAINRALTVHAAFGPGQVRAHDAPMHSSSDHTA